jgi:L-arabinonolactonase
MQTTSSAAEVSTSAAAGAKPGLRWDPVRRQWWWADPDGYLVYGWQGGPELGRAAMAFAAAGGRGRLPAGVFAVRLQERAATLAICASGCLLLGMGKRLALLDLGGAALDGLLKVAAVGQHLQVLHTIDAAEPRTAISDGCVDTAGHFVFGTANTAADRRAIGSFYQYSWQHGVRRLALPAVARAAHIAVSGDGERLYFADADQGGLMECRYDAASARVGEIRRRDGAADDVAVPAAGLLFLDGVQS